MDRVAVFIDEGYLNKALDNLGRPKLDYGKFIQTIKGALPILRTYYYYCMPYLSPVPTESERSMFTGKQSFIRFLARQPRMELRQGRLAKRGNEFVQKRVDIMLAVDLVRLASLGLIKEAVLVAGDSDLVPAIYHVKDAGVSVSLWYEHGSAHDELLDACDELHGLTKDFIGACLRETHADFIKA